MRSHYHNSLGLRQISHLFEKLKYFSERSGVFRFNFFSSTKRINILYDTSQWSEVFSAEMSKHPFFSTQTRPHENQQWHANVQLHSLACVAHTLRRPFISSIDVYYLTSSTVNSELKEFVLNFHNCSLNRNIKCITQPRPTTFAALQAWKALVSENKKWTSAHTHTHTHTYAEISQCTRSLTHTKAT